MIHLFIYTLLLHLLLCCAFNALWISQTAPHKKEVGFFLERYSVGRHVCTETPVQEDMTDTLDWMQENTQAIEFEISLLKSDLFI